MKLPHLFVLLAIALPLRAEEAKKNPAKDAKGVLSGLLKKFDQDGDGKLSDSEKEALHSKLKKEVLDRYDVDHDGKLSETEKAAAKADAKQKFDKDGKGGGALENKARAEFNKRFDKDGDGKLNDEEKKAALEAMKKLKEKADPKPAKLPTAPAETTLTPKP